MTFSFTGAASSTSSHYDFRVRGKPVNKGARTPVWHEDSTSRGLQAAGRERVEGGLVSHHAPQAAQAAAYAGRLRVKLRSYAPVSEPQSGVPPVRLRATRHNRRSSTPARRRSPKRWVSASPSMPALPWCTQPARLTCSTSNLETSQQNGRGPPAARRPCINTHALSGGSSPRRW